MKKLQRKTKLITNTSVEHIALGTLPGEGRVEHMSIDCNVVMKGQMAKETLMVFEILESYKRPQNEILSYLIYQGVQVELGKLARLWQAVEEGKLASPKMKLDMTKYPPQQD